MNRQEFTRKVIKLKSCPVCNEEVTTFGIQFRFKSEDNRPLCFRFCSWAHFDEFKQSRNLELEIENAD